jgi:DNA mismatch repair protein MutS
MKNKTLFLRSMPYIMAFVGTLLFNFSYAKDETVFAKVMENNLFSLKYIEEEWPIEEYYSYIDRCMKTQNELKEYQKRQVVFQLFDKWALKHKRVESIVCSDQTTWKDLNLFCGQSDLQSYFASKIDRCNTIFGRAMLYTHLVQPHTDIKEIQKRQSIIKYLIEYPDLLQELDQALSAVQESENMFLSFWVKDELKEFALNYRYLQWPWKKLNNVVNKSDTILTGMNTVMHNTNIMWVTSLLAGAGILLPISVAKFCGAKFSNDNTYVKWAEDVTEEQVGGFLITKLQKWAKDFLNDDEGSSKLVSGLGVLAGVYAGLSIKEYVNWTRAQFAVESCLNIKLVHVARVVDAVNKFKSSLDKHKSLDTLLSQSSKLAEFLNTKNKKADEKQLFDFVSKLYHKKAPEYKNIPKLLWYSLVKGLTFSKGGIFVNYILMNENKECFEDALASIGELDMYVSLTKLYKEHQNKEGQYCFAQFKQSSTPELELKDFWNPFIDPSKVVTNSLQLGTPETPRNMIITGPNAGGKSTILKAVAISVLMAQSFGIAPAKSMVLTPFSKITTYLNIADDIGAGRSLFKAQALRAQKLLDNLDKMKPGEFGFLIVDEMFNGTSPKEAEASAFSVAKNIGEHPLSMCLIATHYPLLTYLGYESSDFINCNVSVSKSGNGNISYPFKLHPGISDQHVALEILRAQGFHGAILDNAESIIKDPTFVERSLHEISKV